MKITSVDAGIVDVPLRGAFAIAHRSVGLQRSVLACVRTDAGLIGWGNVDPTPGYTEMPVEEIVVTAREIARSLAGSDPCNILAALARMDQSCAERHEAKVLLEMALFDLRGKALGVPVWSLLGGWLREQMTFNAWIGVVPPDQAGRDLQGMARVRRRSPTPIMDRRLT